MFIKADLQFKEPICLCLEQNTVWTVVQGDDGANLIVSCKTCKVKITVPAKEFRASITFANPYPGKPAPKKQIDVVEKGPGDVIDLTAYLKRRKQDGPPS